MDEDTFTTHRIPLEKVIRYPAVKDDFNSIIILINRLYIHVSFFLKVLYTVVLTFSTVAYYYKGYIGY